MIFADLFCGWAGFSLAAELAGHKVVYAANHWPLAVEAHELNHPTAAHACQDLRQTDFSQLPDLDGLLASPACQGHSRASQPRRRAYHDALRSTAWAVISCAEAKRPRVVIVENVLDFRRWALFPAWRMALELLGYRVTELELLATCHGVPQRRRRLFIVGILDEAANGPLYARPFTYASPATSREPAFGPCVDWSAGDWRPISAARSGARKRIDAARKRFGERCLVQHVTGHRGIPLSEALRTVTCQDQWAVIDGDRYRPLTVRETARAMGFPESYSWPASATRRDAIKGLGNAVCPPVAADLIRAVAGYLGEEQRRAA